MAADRALIPVYSGGRPRKTNLRDVVDAIFYILRTGCRYPANRLSVALSAEGFSATDLPPVQRPRRPLPHLPASASGPAAVANLRCSRRSRFLTWTRRLGRRGRVQPPGGPHGGRLLAPVGPGSASGPDDAPGANEDETGYGRWPRPALDPPPTAWMGTTSLASIGLTKARFLPDH